MSEESVGDAGASHLGYYSGCFSPADGGRTIAANGYTGALHMWRRSGGGNNSGGGGGGTQLPGDGPGDANGGLNRSGGSGGEEHWVPRHAAGGHYGAVVDMCWGWGDGVLLTAGQDQTARVFASLPSGGWCEVARPQVRFKPCVLGQRED